METYELFRDAARKLREDEHRLEGVALDLSPDAALALANFLDKFGRATLGTSYGDLPFETEVAAIARAYLHR